MARSVSPPISDYDSLMYLELSGPSVSYIGGIYTNLTTIVDFLFLSFEPPFQSFVYTHHVVLFYNSSYLLLFFCAVLTLSIRLSQKWSASNISARWRAPPQLWQPSVLLPAATTSLSTLEIPMDSLSPSARAIAPSTRSCTEAPITSISRRLLTLRLVLARLL